MAIKCHSGFVHYNLYHDRHCHGGGNNFGSIFNITNNCGGGTSFWGGFGAGLGLGFGNLLGGMFGGLMGGFGNMFGGFGGWGNGLSGLWGGGNNAGDRDYSEYASRRSSRRSSSSCDCGCKDKGKDVKDFEDPDNKKIIDLRDKIRANDVTKAQLEGYIKELGELKSKGLTDNYKHDKDVEELGIDALLSEADAKLKKLAGAQNVKPDDRIEGLTDDELSGLRAKWLTVDQIKEALKLGFGPSVLLGLLEAGLKPEDLKTIKELNIDLIDITGGKKALTLPATLSVDSLTKLKDIADKRNIAVAVANNPKATEDRWIAGKIDDIKEENGKLSYTVNCDNFGEFEYKYQVTQIKDDNYSIDVHNDSLSELQEDGKGHKIQKDYQFKNKKLFKQGATVVSKWY